MENWKRPMELEAALPTELIENEIFLNCLDLPSQVSFSLVAKKYRSFFLLKIFPSVLIACNNDENVPVKDWKALAVLLVKTVEYHYLGLFYYFYDYLGIQQIFFETPISHHAILAAFQVGDWPLFNSFRDKIPPDRTLVERCDFSSLRKCPPVAFLERVLNEEEISWLRAELDSSVIRYQLICLCCVAFYDGNLELVKLLGQGLSKRNLRLPMDDIFVLAAYFGCLEIMHWAMEGRSETENFDNSTIENRLIVGDQSQFLINCNVSDDDTIIVLQFLEETIQKPIFNVLDDNIFSLIVFRQWKNRSDPKHPNFAVLEWAMDKCDYIISKQIVSVGNVDFLIDLLRFLKKRGLEPDFAKNKAFLMSIAVKSGHIEPCAILESEFNCNELTEANFHRAVCFSPDSKLLQWLIDRNCSVGSPGSVWLYLNSHESSFRINSEKLTFIKEKFGGNISDIMPQLQHLLEHLTSSVEGLEWLLDHIALEISYQILYIGNYASLSGFRVFLKRLGHETASKNLSQLIRTCWQAQKLQFLRLLRTQFAQDFDTQFRILQMGKSINLWAIRCELVKWALGNDYWSFEQFLRFYFNDSSKPCPTLFTWKTYILPMFVLFPVRKFAAEFVDEFLGPKGVVESYRKRPKPLDSEAKEVLAVFTAQLKERCPEYK